MTGRSTQSIYRARLLERDSNSSLLCHITQSHINLSHSLTLNRPPLRPDKRQQNQSSNFQAFLGMGRHRKARRQDNNNNNKTAITSCHSGLGSATLYSIGGRIADIVTKGPPPNNPCTISFRGLRRQTQPTWSLAWPQFKKIHCVFDLHMGKGKAKDQSSLSLSLSRSAPQPHHCRLRSPCSRSSTRRPRLFSLCFQSIERRES